MFSYQVFVLFIIAIFYKRAAATNKCIWVRGALQCQSDPSKHFNVEVRAYDRDGYGILKVIDPDDLMAVTFTEPDGTFQLDGCGGDVNWLPGVPNDPDPYIRIHHYCNSAGGETLELPEFETFVPQTHDVGIIVLDAKKSAGSPVNFPKPNNPRRQVYSSSAESVRSSRPSTEFVKSLSVEVGEGQKSSTQKNQTADWFNSMMEPSPATTFSHSTENSRGIDSESLMNKKKMEEDDNKSGEEKDERNPNLTKRKNSLA